MPIISAEFLVIVIQVFANYVPSHRDEPDSS
jgi:hypothetical protein